MPAGVILARADPVKNCPRENFMIRARLFLVGLLTIGLLIAGLLASGSETRKASKAVAKHVRIDSIAARAEDVSSIDGIMKAYYDAVSGPAGQPRQWARESTLSKPGTQFVVIMDDDKGKPILLQMTHPQFADTMDPDARFIASHIVTPAGPMSSAPPNRAPA